MNDLSSKATPFGLPHTYLNIILPPPPPPPEVTGLYELKFHMEYSVDKNMILDQNGHHAHIG